MANSFLFSPLPAATRSPCLSPAPRPKKPNEHRLTVMKFGGSSLAGAEHLRRVASIVEERLPLRPVVVLSAMGKTTNKLLAAADKALTMGVVDVSDIEIMLRKVLEELQIPVPKQVNDLLEELKRVLSGVAMLKEVSDRTRDFVVSFGERLSVRVFAAYFNSRKNGGKVVGARAFDSWELGMLTTSGAGSAISDYSSVSILPIAYEKINASLESLEKEYTHIPVVTGYIAKDEKGVITTLGRDGSDLTATVIGAAVSASEVQIWKDVSGILTTDPRIVAAAQPVPLVTFEEAAEMATFGAKVVHPAAVLPAWEAKIPMSVRNSLRPEDPGTRIVAELGGRDVRDSRVVNISSKQGILMVVIRSTRMLGQHGFLAHVFQVFNEFEASVDVIATSEITVSLTLDKSFKDVDIAGLRKKLEKVANVEMKENMASLTLISDKEKSSSVLRDSFDAFEELGVNTEMVSHGASNVNVTFILPDSGLAPSIRKLHEVFFERPEGSPSKRPRLAEK